MYIIYNSEHYNTNRPTYLPKYKLNPKFEYNHDTKLDASNYQFFPFRKGIKREIEVHIFFIKFIVQIFHDIFDVVFGLKTN